MYGIIPALPFDGKLASMRPILVALTIALLTSACVRSASTPLPYRQNPFTPEASTHLCAAADLKTSSSAHDETGAVSLGVAIINQSKDACKLQPRPGISLFDGEKALDVELIQTKADSPSLNIFPGESVILVMSWRNYCGEVLKANPEIHLALTGSDSLSIQTQLSASPRCEDKKSPSTLTVNPYSYPP